MSFAPETPEKWEPVIDEMNGWGYRNNKTGEFSKRDPFSRLNRTQFFNAAPQDNPAFIDYLRDNWDGPSTDIFAPNIALNNPVGRGLFNGPGDVASTQMLLHDADYYDVDPTDGPTGIFSNGLDKAIRQYQSDNGLTADGALHPGGETIGSLVAGAAPAVLGLLGSALNTVIGGVTDAVTGIGHTIGSAVSGIGDLASDAADNVGGWFGSDNTPSTTSGTQVYNTSASSGGVYGYQGGTPQYEVGSGYNYQQPTPTTSGQTIIPGVNDQQVKSTIGRNEDTIPYMYNDIYGNITVGDGVEVNSPKEAQAMPFNITLPDGTTRSATQQEIADAFNKVNDAPSGKSIPATRFNPQTNPYFDRLSLDPSYMDSQFEDKLGEHADQLDQALANRGIDYDSLPSNVKLGLLDAHYNMGAGTFAKLNPNFWTALQNGDWNTAGDIAGQHVTPGRDTADLFRYTSTWPDHF